MKSNTSFFFPVIFALSFFCLVACNDYLNDDLTEVSSKKTYTIDNLAVQLKSITKSDRDEVISVAGIVHEVNTINNRPTILLKGNVAAQMLVICDMNANQSKRIEKVKKGDSILIKGVFKGVLKDAIMLNCVIVNGN